MRVNPRFGVLAVAAVLLGYGFFRLESQGPNGVQPVDKLTVIDSKGKRVGPVQGFIMSYPIVAVSVERKLVLLGVDHYRFTGTNIQTTHEIYEFRFESTNCTGIPYLTGVGGFYPDMAPHHVLFYNKLFVPDGDRRRVIIRSEGIPNGTQCQPTLVWEYPDALPLRFVIDLANEFQPPFTLQ